MTLTLKVKLAIRKEFKTCFDEWANHQNMILGKRDKSQEQVKFWVINKYYKYHQSKGVLVSAC